ncbi:16S rRNA (uracil(1498)-N(3))-methyltransferase [Halorhodospira halochloris]|uniref:Ribosomal RNA small subunit methyltransferase E n=1 Tax=Halorhodospira halochloris TaxID=1052 RepID=A0A0X8XAQ6_HALHR|nr:16S rRNA (uracil(1498)-N(3))-methyltransferase [Halorhodospira halochloris]MBK1651077.1 16S rRNA (uracil(1498)-N(3))-methyltransferase [Halorhodospira halochloris]MCG5529436.1 16S rRNA (uracil(1498)-N(3))-methyltransferase [Halorhodospira halochloris]BAU56409.1 ribosomal RNA small subunit methyltransferase E [Halorhodospira halochloris]
MVRLYVQQSLTPGEEIELPPNPAAHVKARRLSSGDAVTLFTGEGGEYPSLLTSVQRRQITAQVGDHQPVERELPYPVMVLQAVIKGERMDTAVEKATELGASAIIPTLTQRCVVRLDDDKRASKRQRHWQAVAASACEQCGRNRLPWICKPTPLEQVWPLLEGYNSRLLLNQQAQQTLAAQLKPEATALLIGPEGGLNGSDIELAEQLGFRAAYAGARIMRSETATIAAMSRVSGYFEEL